MAGNYFSPFSVRIPEELLFKIGRASCRERVS